MGYFRLSSGLFIRVDGLESQLMMNTGWSSNCLGSGNAKVNSLRVSYPRAAALSVLWSACDLIVQCGDGLRYTFRVDKKAICLRVERDPRETDDVGFGGAEEKVDWYENVVGYEVTSVNLMIGVVQKSSGLRNRKVKQGSMSYGGCLGVAKPSIRLMVCVGVERYGHKSVILNQGEEWRLYVGNSKLVD